METKAITEGAVMAALTAILGLAGIYVPMLSPIIMLIWTLPVVLVCMRHGMRTGAVTIAVAGIAIMSLSTPLTALNMMFRSAGPALLIGCGFRFRWRSEKTILYTSAAAFAGLLADLAITVFVMGISIREMFYFEPELVNELITMFTDYGLMTSQDASLEEMAAFVNTVASTMYLMVPAMLVIYSLFSAFTNYITANLVLRKLQAPLPPVTRLSTFRMPIVMLFGYILGFGLTVTGSAFWPETPMVTTVGQNISIIFLTIFIVQGVGLFVFFIEKAPPSMRGVLKFLMVFAIIVTVFNFLVIIGYIGIADALFDFRRLDITPTGKEAKED